jgi:hypothetical protein
MLLFLNQHSQFIYLIISQDRAIIKYTLRPRYCLKKLANLFVILRNSGNYVVEKWKGECRGEERKGECRGEERKGERANLETPYYPLSNFYIYQH